MPSFVIRLALTGAVRIFVTQKKGRRQKKRLGGGRAPSRIVAVHKGHKGGRVNQQ